jgi:GNAT superfamily N-acetyltransferase
MAPRGAIFISDSVKENMIRQGTREDLPRALELIRELAEFEKASNEVINTVELMEKDGFGSDPVFGFFVAQEDEFIVGISLYYYRYSTWKGRRLYLEDIIVTEAYRGRGIGKLLFERTMLKALHDGCSGMVWQVLDWNEAAIKFYGNYGARLDGEWINCSLETNEIEHLLNR